MDIQKHTRTHQIKRVAHHLYRVLSVVRYLLFLGWPAIVLVAFLPGGTLLIGETAVELEYDDYTLKGLILFLYACGLFLMIQVTQYFKRLMLQFREGHIFSEQAIKSVRGALRTGIALAVLSWIHAVLGSIYSYWRTDLFDFSFTTEIVIATIYFGLMYTLLWALEIGFDLNEESEKTI